MTTVSLTLLACAVLDSLNPSVLGVTLYLLLTRARRATLGVLVYVGTVAATYLAIGVALMFGLGALTEQIQAAARHPASHFAIALVGAGLLTWSCADGYLEKRDPSRRLRRKSRLPGARRRRLPALMTLGVVVTVVEFATAAPYLAAIGLLTARGWSTGLWLPALTGYVLVMSLPPLLLLATHRVLGDRVEARMRRWQERLAAGARSMLHWIVGIVGVVFIRYGVVRLLTDLGILNS